MDVEKKLRVLAGDETLEATVALAVALDQRITKLSAKLMDLDNRSVARKTRDLLDEDEEGVLCYIAAEACHALPDDIKLHIEDYLNAEGYHDVQTDVDDSVSTLDMGRSADMEIQRQIAVFGTIREGL